jgi:RND family efflux transporter MFP subunit
MLATRRSRIVALTLAVALVAGGVLAYRFVHTHGWPFAAGISAEEIWTCPMHPEVREPAPGRCPKCGMDLVKVDPSAPIESGTDDIASTAIETPRGPVELDTRRRQLLGVRTARAERQSIDRHIRAVGLVRYDETRLADVNLKLDGWINKLHVDYTGQAVRRGQPLLELYSPDLLATQQEYLLALGTREAMERSQVPDARLQAERLVESARQRLTLWDLPDQAIVDLERTRQAQPTVTFRSPVSGYVIEKPAVEGMRAMPGQTLYRIADLSSVWVETDVYEADAPFVKVGAPAVVTLDAWPGEERRGKAVYIYPFVEEKTRTLKVRYAFPNPGLRLKPGMYANVEMKAAGESGVTIPRDALLDAGRDQLVFVASGDGYFEPRRVQAGQPGGDRVQILSGLKEGEHVAVGAAFFLDSESQLRAAAGGWESTAAPDAASAPAGPANGSAGPSISFTTEPSPPRSGENVFQVRLTAPDGTPVADAQVKVVLFMPAMPSMNMPAMSSEAQLAHAGGGLYRGAGMVSMAGRWDVTVTVTRGGSRFTRQTTVVAR